MKAVIFRPSFRHDLNNAREWYEARRGGLGARFERAVQQCVRQVLERPRHCRKWRGEVRRAVTKHFPYLIYYVDAAEHVLVLALLHGRRSRGAIQRRVRETQ